MARPLIPSRGLLRYLTTANRGQPHPFEAEHHRPCSTRHLSDRKLQWRSQSKTPVLDPGSRTQRRNSSSSPLPDTPVGGDYAPGPRNPPPPDTSSYYSLFPTTLSRGPPPSGPFLVNVAELRKEYLQLQAVHHPDKYPPDRKRQADILSGLLGEAYRTLTNPLLCAQYLLLTKYDIDMNAESAKSSASDQEMLANIMEVQEAASEAETEEEVEQLRSDNVRRIEKCVRALETAFESDNASLAQKECVKLKYWSSLQDALRDWERGSEIRLEH